MILNKKECKRLLYETIKGERKEMKKFLAVAFAAILLVGCSAEEKKVICKETTEEDNYVYEFYASGDTLNTHNIDVTVDLATWELAESDLTGDNLAVTKAMLDDYYVNSYLDLKGITTDSKISDDHKTYTASIKINFKEADFDELEKAGFVEKDIDEISLEQTLVDYTGCEEQEL